MLQDKDSEIKKKRFFNNIKTNCLSGLSSTDKELLSAKREVKQNSAEKKSTKQKETIENDDSNDYEFDFNSSLYETND
jgi:hypothetical protein